MISRAKGIRGIYWHRDLAWNMNGVKYELANWYSQKLSIRRILLIGSVSSHRRIRLSCSRLNVKSIAPVQGKGLFFCSAYARPPFFRWTKASRRDMDGSPADRPALRNVTASKFDSHISVARGAFAAPVFTAAAARPDSKSSFSRRPRHAHSPIPRGAPLATRIPVLSSSCDAGPAPRDRRKQCQGLARAERTGPRGLSALQRDARRWYRWHGDGPRAKIDRFPSRFGVFTLREIANFFSRKACRMEHIAEFFDKFEISFSLTNLAGYLYEFLILKILIS